MQIPKAGVSEIMTMEGKFVRAAYNNEGYVILGYQAANYSVGEEWLLLEVGITVRERVSDYTLTRDRLSLETPDGTTLPLPTIEEHREADTRAVQQRSKVQRDSINYFPPSAHQACALVFFPDLTSRALPRDDAELSSSRACVGRLFFKVPGGIKYGQHWLNVKFEQGLIRVPFRILTKKKRRRCRSTTGTSRSRSRTHSSQRRTSEQVGPVRDSHRKTPDRVSEGVAVSR